MIDSEGTKYIEPVDAAPDPRECFKVMKKKVYKYYLLKKLHNYKFTFFRL
jgi:hypothetical protein